MKAITICTSILLVVSGSVVHAGTPIFIDKIKSKFSRSSQNTTQPVSVTSKSKSAETSSTSGVVKKPTATSRASRAEILANRRAALSMATAKSEQDARQMEAYRLAATQQGTAGAGAVAPTATGASAQPSKQPARVVIKKKTPDTESNTPKPIFRNFR